MTEALAPIAVDNTLGRPPELTSLRDRWTAQWPRALTLWSKFTRLSEPRWCFTQADAKHYGLTESFAMIRLTDHAVVLNLEQIHERKLDGFGVEIMAHEIGHHIYCPASMLDQGRMLARMRRGLPTREHLAPLVANLYADLLLNDRLQRDAGQNMAAVYQALGVGAGDRMWTLYMRIYEILWSLQKTTLAPGPTDDRLEGDAQLGARLIRSYSRDWLDGAGRFAALCLPYLLENDGQAIRKLLRGWLDTEACGH